MESSIVYSFGGFIFGYLPSFLGSVTTPYMAAATATSGLHRYTFASFVPLLPSKFLLNVRRDTPPEEGDWPLPMQGPHVFSRILMPASTRLASPFLWAIMSRTCLLPGDTVTLTSGWTLYPPFLKTSETTMRSLYEEFVQLPMQTWSTLNPSMSVTLQTLSGECGWAIRGSSLPRFISIASSY